MITKRSPTAAEKRYIEQIKEMACLICDAPGPSDAHHIKQTTHYLAIPLCKDCHQGAKNGIHGARHMWKVTKMDEFDALGKLIGLMHASGR